MAAPWNGLGGREFPLIQRRFTQGGTGLPHSMALRAPVLLEQACEPIAGQFPKTPIEISPQLCNICPIS